MERTAATNAQAKRGDLGVGDIDARGTVAPRGDDVPVFEGVDDRLLDAR
jgi:hypothetical protein